jgi:hypothetical protein
MRQHTIHHPTLKGMEAARKAVATKFTLGRIRESFFSATVKLTGRVPTQEEERTYARKKKQALRRTHGLPKFYVLEQYVTEHIARLQAKDSYEPSV